MIIIYTLTGAVCGAILGYREKSGQNTLHHLAAGILVLATIGVLLCAVISGFYIRFW